MENPTHTKEYIHEFLQSQNFASIATVDENGMPSVATVFYVVDDHLNLFFSTRQHSKKYTNIQQNHRIAVVVTDTEQLVTVQMNGVAAETQDAGEMSYLMDAIMKMGAQQDNTQRWVAPVHALKDGYFAVMKITPDWARVADFRDTHKTAEEYFHETEFTGDALKSNQ